MIHVVGQPASGKTTLGKALAAALGYAFASIDDERIALLRPGRYWPDDDSEAWRRLEAKASGEVVVETAGARELPAALTILCVAPTSVRRARLQQRTVTGYRLARGNRHYVARLMAVPPPVIRADLTWNGSHPASIAGLLSEVQPRL